MKNSGYGELAIGHLLEPALQEMRGTPDAFDIAGR
jgi:hypothetical protein